jgi:hypothetical protein
MARALVLRSGRSPFQVLLMAACLISGVSGLLPHEQRSIIDQLADGRATAWYAGLIFGGIVVLVGLFLRLPTSLLVERVGLLLLTGLFIGYGIGIYLLLGFEQVRVGGVIIIACGAACGVRTWQIGHDLSRLRRALADPIELADDGPQLADPDDSGAAP